MDIHRLDKRTRGSPARMRELLEPDFELRFEDACTVFRAPDGAAVWELWKQSHGLTVTRLAALDTDMQKAFQDAFVEFHERYRTEPGITMPRDYIVAVGTRR